MGQAIMWAECFLALIFIQFVSAFKLVCFVTNWSQFRKSSAQFTPTSIDPNLCTHIIYAFNNITNSKIGMSEWNDATRFQELNRLKSRNPNLKILMSVGGYKLGSEPFRRITESPAKRSEFVRSAIEYVRAHNCDGLDISWHGAQHNDRPQLTQLLQDLESAFKSEAKKKKKEKLILSVSLPAGREAIDSGYEVEKISAYVDFINFLTYDFHGPWEKHTGHGSPLQKSSVDQGSASAYNVDYAVKYLMQKGAPRKKIMMGITAYGHTFTLSSLLTVVGAGASGAGTAGAFTQEPGTLSYYEICSFNQGATKRWIEEQAVPYSYKGNQWAGYEDVKSVALKVQYMKSNNLGGVSLWAMDLDDFSGTFCNEGKYPLLTAIKREMDKKNP